MRGQTSVRACPQANEGCPVGDALIPGPPPPASSPSPSPGSMPLAAWLGTSHHRLSHWLIWQLHHKTPACGPPRHPPPLDRQLRWFSLSAMVTSPCAFILLPRSHGQCVQTCRVPLLLGGWTNRYFWDAHTCPCCLGQGATNCPTGCLMCGRSPGWGRRPLHALYPLQGGRGSPVGYLKEPKQQGLPLGTSSTRCLHLKHTSPLISYSSAGTAPTGSTSRAPFTQNIIASCSGASVDYVRSTSPRKHYHYINICLGRVVQ